MKVVLFCGGQGMRLREYSHTIPKPLVPLGDQPILWHVMKYYSHYGHREFILCLGHQGEVIKQYFLDYDECLTNDFVLRGRGTRPELLSRDHQNWKITFVDTGAHASIGERLMAVEGYLRDEESFLANYSDGLTDVPLPEMVKFFNAQGTVASFLRVRPTQSIQAVMADARGFVRGIRDLAVANVAINGGFFVFRREIFRYLRTGEDLVPNAFDRLIERKELSAFSHAGFWACMDTYRDKRQLEDLLTRGEAPWQVWRKSTEGFR
jgi:glucose-1-phosphate cytidylyltransferase